VLLPAWTVMVGADTLDTPLVPGLLARPAQADPSIFDAIHHVHMQVMMLIIWRVAAGQLYPLSLDTVNLADMPAIGTDDVHVLLNSTSINHRLPL